ncbi:MAG: ACT domain-containing protein [Syntrophales bacterium]|jgi:hypothetical protein
MLIEQISVFAENRPGRLAAVTRILAKEKINIRAISISTSDTFGVINLIVNKPKYARQALSRAGMMVHPRKVLALMIGDDPGSLDHLTQLLAGGNININNAYGFIIEPSHRAVFVIDADEAKKAEKLAEDAGFKTINAKVLSTFGSKKL